ncbi:MAG: SDR family NAD(P)-dependent oxidoreductase [Saprospiraceae bacterium]|nr:SDR family NAD(P)-dependent oxidoreductase [Saprospiraceae bacterium]|tara:strand:+ start:1171 stop:1875 length:705 start_codon:yes stop_codon:yes gene_type:complete
MATAIVTGGTKGIGRAICDILISNGFNISVTARSQKDLSDLKEVYKDHYPNLNVHIAKVDMSKKNEVLAYADEVLESFEHIDILVNNAGTFIPGQIINEDEGALEKMIETNLYSAYYMTRGIVERMIEQGRGHVFNMCSIASFMAYPNGGSYAISKFALLGFSKSLREELKEKGIKVTSVLPGATWSASWDGVDLPEERLMKATDVAQSIFSAYNLSDSAVVEEIVIRPQLGDL